MESGILEIQGLPECPIFEVSVDRQVTKRKARSLPNQLAAADTSGVLELGLPVAEQEARNLDHPVLEKAEIPPKGLRSKARGDVILNGMNLFNPRQPFWRGKAPDIKYPE